MQFYGFFRSSAAYRCRIAFNLKGVMPDVTLINLRKAEQKSEKFLTKNPFALVPALEVEEGLLTQSLAIIDYLEAAHPSPALLPRKRFDKAYVRSLALAIACDMHPLQNLRVLNYLKTTLGHSQEEADKWCQDWLLIGLEAFEKTLETSGTMGKFCYKNTPTLADICLCPQLYSARRFGVDFSHLPRLLALEAAYASHPAFVNAHPEKQPDYVA